MGVAVRNKTEAKGSGRAVNIVGAGLSGLAAAIRLAERGIPVNLISAQPSERAQSVLAEGGINAALDVMGEGDTTAEHAAETLEAGAMLADKAAVRDLCEAAPDIVQWLLGLGVPFQTENGRLVQRFFGGQAKRRATYAQSSTGKALMTALIDEARRFEAVGAIRRCSHHELAGLLLVNGSCVGAQGVDVFTGEHFCCRGPVLLAAGGLNGFFAGETTGTRTNRGEAQAIAFAAGACFGNLEMIQYHPTTVRIAGKRLLISEAARAEGGRLYILRNGAPWYFMEEKYPSRGNLMPRDVVSREMAAVRAREDTGDQVFLDLTGLSRGTWTRRLPDLRGELLHYLAVDPARMPVPVEPGIHFFMGGLLVDRAHRTSIRGLFAAGECACQYHGANRLGGNSLLGAIYGGMRAAQSIAEAWTVSGATSPDALSDADGDALSPGGANPGETTAFAVAVRAILSEGLGIAREEKTLASALAQLDACVADEALTDADRRRGLLARAMLLSAQARRESRGAHLRTDYPARDDEHFLKTTVARMRNGEVTIDFAPIGGGGADDAD